MKVISFIKNTIDETKCSIKNMKSNIFDSMGQLLPVTMGAISIVAFVIAYILFLINEGYSNQIDIIQSSGLSNLREVFTKGKVDIIYSSVVMTIINSLFVIQLIIMLITYFKREKLVQKILLIVDFVALILFVVTYFYFTRFSLSEAETKFGNKMPTIIDMVHKLPFAIMITGAILVVLLVIAKNRWMLGHGLLALVISYIVVPLVLLLIQNIIPAVLIGILIVLFGFIFVVALGGDESSGSSGAGYSSKPIPRKEPVNVNVKKENGPRVLAKNYSDNDRFYRDKGGLGILTPQGENGMCIYVDREGFTANKHEFVCTTGEYDKGKVIIRTRTGRNVKV